MSVTTFYTNKPQGGVFKYSVGSVIIKDFVTHNDEKRSWILVVFGEKGIQIDLRGFIRGGFIKYFHPYPEGLLDGGVIWGGVEFIE